MIEAVIFDMDGVLVDTEPFHMEIERRQFLQNGLDLSYEEHQKYNGIASDVMLEKIAMDYGLVLPLEELVEQNKSESIRYFSELDEIPVMPGLVNLLEKLQQISYPRAVASSSFPEIIDLILTKTGLRGYFEVVVSSQDAGKSKPEPDVFLLAAKRLGKKNENCLVVEDSKNGIRAALAAGMFCVAFQGPGAKPENQKEADIVISEFGELEPMLFK
jgi:HAD superfamily hydrolase (TIGR01509 family)